MTYPPPVISFAAPAREHQSLRDELEAAVLRVLRSGSYVLGAEVEQFEAELAASTGARFAVALSSGTDALVCALHALQIGRGDEVIVPAFGFVSAAEAVVRVGAIPVFVDVEPSTLGPDPGALRRVLTRATRAVIVMHLFGQAVDLEAVQRGCGQLPIIEDAAQAMGTLHRGKQVGTQAELGTLSFFPAKSLGAAGDGGAVLTSNPGFAAAVRASRVHGSAGAYGWQQPGGNYRLDALQAAVLRVKLAAFPARIARRKAIGERMAELVRERGVQVLAGDSACTPTFAPFAIRVRDRDRVAGMLRDHGIDVRVQYPSTLPGCAAFSGYAAGSYPEAERATRELLSLPCHAELTDAELERIERALGEALGHA